MRTLLQRIGVAAWWAIWPALIVHLYNKPRTRALVKSGGKIIVVKGWLGNGKWTLPGGGLHKNEEPHKGVLREIREETNLHLDPSALHHAFTETYRYRGIKFPCHYFEAELATRPALKPELLEICQASWIEPSNLNSKNSNPDVLAAIKRAGI